MFQIFICIFLLQSSKSSSSTSITEQSQFVVPELVPILNELRNERILNNIQIKIYDELIKKSQQLDEHQKSFMSKISKLQTFISNYYDRHVTAPSNIHLNDSVPYNIVLVVMYSEFVSLESKYDDFFSEVVNFLAINISCNIFRNFELQRIKNHLTNIHNFVQDAKNKVGATCELVENMNAISHPSGGDMSRSDIDILDLLIN